MQRSLSIQPHTTMEVGLQSRLQAEPVFCAPCWKVLSISVVSSSNKSRDILQGMFLEKKHP